MAKKAEIIKQMLLEGANYPEIMKTIGVAKSTISYHAKMIGMSTTAHDWERIQLSYDSNKDLHMLMKDFRLHRVTIWDACRSGKLKVEKTLSELQKEIRAISLDDIFKDGSGYESSTVRTYVKRNELLPYGCAIEECILHKTTEWCGSDIKFHLDHINGVRTDHRLENLRWLCPNCHSQTSTYCGRNSKGTKKFVLRPRRDSNS